MLKSHRGAMVLAGLVLLLALGTACNEKAPTESTSEDYCAENPQNC